MRVLRTTRREWLTAAMTVPASAMFVEQSPSLPVEAARALRQEDGELVYVGRDPVRIKVSPSGRGRLAMITQDVSPGTTIPVHLHEKEDEIIFIQSGTGEATLNDRRLELAAGSTLFVPQGTWHGGRNTGSDTLRWVAIYSPSGFEGYFREIGRLAPDAPPRTTSPEERAQRDARYGIRYR